MQRASAGTLAVGEDVELRNVQSGDEIKGTVEHVVRLATHADNDIDADESIGHPTFDLLHLVGEEGGVIATTHQLQHLVGTTLQRHVEMGHEGARICTKPDDFIRQKIRLYA